MDREAFYADARQDLTGPLAGVVVLEATTTWAGPMAGCLLADFGALVIKVEHPEGEVARRIPPFVPGSTLSVFNETVNRNKKSLSLDLRRPEGRDIFLALCREADVVIENFTRGRSPNGASATPMSRRSSPTSSTCRSAASGSLARCRHAPATTRSRRTSAAGLR